MVFDWSALDRTKIAFLGVCLGEQMFRCVLLTSAGTPAQSHCWHSPPQNSDSSLPFTIAWQQTPNVHLFFGGMFPPMQICSLMINFLWKRVELGQEVQNRRISSPRKVTYMLRGTGGLRLPLFQSTSLIIHWRRKCVDAQACPSSPWAKQLLPKHHGQGQDRCCRWAEETRKRNASGSIHRQSLNRWWALPSETIAHVLPLLP